AARAVSPGHVPQVRPHGQAAVGQPPVDRHQRADDSVAQTPLEPADLPALAAAAKVFGRGDAHVGHHWYAMQGAGDVRAERPAQDLLSQDHIEVVGGAAGVGERPRLEAQPAAGDFFHRESGSAIGDAVLETARFVRTLCYHHRQLADLAETDDETDVGEAFDEEEDAQGGAHWAALSKVKMSSAASHWGVQNSAPTHRASPSQR